MRCDDDGMDMSLETIAVKAGRPEPEPDQPLNIPLTMASTYVAGGDLEYGRYGNPTWQAFESAIGQLEGGRALAFSSGMAAVAAVLDLVSPGAHVVAPMHCYLGTLAQLATLEQRGLVKVTTVDVADSTAVVAALTEDTAVLWLESPTNPMLEIADIAGLAAQAKDLGVTVVVDNTFATPLAQRPLDLGADIVVHSATKMLGGHADLLLGVLVSRQEDALNAIEERRKQIGAVPGVLESWLALRGLRTLHLRVERAQSNATELTRRLQAHSAVERVRYPGFGSIAAFEVRGGADVADRLSLATRVWIHATSLGGVESTLERRRRWAGEAASVPESLVRLSVGIEHIDDLWSDLDHALTSST
jgi:cystathionine gamma-synthase